MIDKDVKQDGRSKKRRAVDNSMDAARKAGSIKGVKPVGYVGATYLGFQLLEMASPEVKMAVVQLVTAVMGVPAT